MAARREKDEGRKRAGKAQKKRLHVLFDHTNLAFSGWENENAPWSMKTCETYIEWCHIGHLFPASRHFLHRKYNGANLKYCNHMEFKERCIQVYQHLYNKELVFNNRINLTLARMVYAEQILKKLVDWRTIRLSRNSVITLPSTSNIPENRKFEDGGLGRVVATTIIPDEEIEWSATSSDDEHTECSSQTRRDFEQEVKQKWLHQTLLDMAANEENEVEANAVPIPEMMEISSPQIVNDIEYIKTLEEEVNCSRKLVLEYQERIEVLQLQLQEKDSIILELQNQISTS